MVSARALSYESSMLPTEHGSAVELRLGKTAGRLVEDLVCAAKFAVLTLEILNPRSLLARLAAHSARVDLGTLHPVAQRLHRATKFLRDRTDRPPTRAVPARTGC